MVVSGNYLQVGSNFKLTTTASEVATFGITTLVNTSSTNTFQFATSGGTTYMDLCSGGNTDYDSRLRSDGGSASAGNGYLSCETTMFIAPQFEIGAFGSSRPMISYAISGTPNTFNTNTFQVSLGNIPDNSFTNNTSNFIMPFASRLVGWSIAGDPDTHTAVTMRFRLTTGLTGGGVVYYDQQGDLTANAITNATACMSLFGSVARWTNVGNFNTGTRIGAGVQLYCYCNTSVNMNCEFSLILFFQHLN